AGLAEHAPQGDVAERIELLAQKLLEAVAGNHRRAEQICSRGGAKFDPNFQAGSRRQSEKGIEGKLVDLSLQQIVEARLRNAEAPRGPRLRRVPTPDRFAERCHDVGSHRHVRGIFRIVLDRIPYIRKGSALHRRDPRFTDYMYLYKP